MKTILFMRSASLDCEKKFTFCLNHHHNPLDNIHLTHSFTVLSIVYHPCRNHSNKIDMHDQIIVDELMRWYHVS